MGLDGLKIPKEETANFATSMRSLYYAALLMVFGRAVTVSLLYDHFGGNTREIIMN
jgi:hypothetical protein